MRLPRVLPSLMVLCCCFAAFPSLAQVNVVTPETRDLMRIAQRYRVSIEQIQNGRKALEKATELARSLKPLRGHELQGLARLWSTYYRPRARETLVSILDDLRRCAQESAAEYPTCTGAASNMLGPLSDLDADKAEDYALNWPPAPAKPGAPSAGGNEGLIRQQFVRHLLYNNPDKAMAYLEKFPHSLPAGDADRARLMPHLTAAGRQEEATALIDQALDEFRRSGSDPSRTNAFGQFVAQLADVAPSRFMEAFTLLAERIDGPQRAGHSIHVEVSGSGVAMPVNAGEAALLTVLRRLGNRPELTIQALAAVPALKARLEAAGGIDKVLHPRPPGPQFGFYPGGPAGVSPGRQARWNELTRLQSEMAGEALKNPALVRGRLAAWARGDDDAELLHQLALLSNHRFPEFSALALEEALRRVDDVKPLQKRMAMLQMLISTWRRLEGDLPPELLKQGFILADQMREEAPNTGPPLPDGSPRRNNAADELEGFLVSEYARDNFPAAMRFAEGLEDDTQRLRALMRIAQGLFQH